jgi:hypothetical protein
MLMLLKQMSVAARAGNRALVNAIVDQITERQNSYPNEINLLRGVHYRRYLLYSDWRYCRAMSMLAQSRTGCSRRRVLP